jgi:putative ABC transport system permease protein
VDRTNLGDWGNRSYVGVARLRAGESPASATADLHLTSDRWVQAGFLRDNGDGALHRDALPIQAFVTGDVRRPLLILLVAVVAVLLIACANVANLLLARADVRQREIAMRTALGASRAELVRQLLVESVTLAAVGGLFGLALVLLARRALGTITAASLPRADTIAIDPTVLGVSAVLTLVSGLVFGLLPAWRLSRPDLVATLNDGGRSGTAGAGRHAFRRVLVVSQLAGSVVLLVVAGLLVRSLIEMSRVDLGFDDRQVLTAQVQLPASDYPQPADIVRFYRELMDRAAQLPGVEAAGAVRVLPLSRTIGDWSITIEGRPLASPNENPNADYQAVTPGYFRVMRLAVERGRALTEADREGAMLVAVINDVMAARYWPGQDALGKRFHMGTADQPWLTIVGIVKQVRHNAVIEPPRAEMYLAHAQLPDEIRSTPRAMTVVLRTAGDPPAVAGALGEAVRAMDRRLPLADVRTMSSVTADALAGPRFTALVLGLFAFVALAIAAVGIYGTMALIVSERSQELGIRLALGAAPGALVRMVVGQGAGLAAAGIGLGLVGAALAARTVGSLLYGVRALDPLTFVGVPLVLAIVTLVACAGPARRATRVDPVATLRG